MFDFLTEEYKDYIEIEGILQPIGINTNTLTALLALHEFSNPNHSPATKQKQIIKMIIRQPNRILNCDQKTVDKAFLAVLGYLFLCDMENPEKTPNSTPVKVFDWVQDSRYVMAAFRQEYRIGLTELRTMHWWEFKGLFDALNMEHTALGQRISIRCEEPAKDAQTRIRQQKRKNTVALIDTTAKTGKEKVANAFNDLA